MAQTQISRPRRLKPERARTGVQPFVNDVSALRKNSYYLRNHMGPGQVFTYSGPGPGAGSGQFYPDYDCYDSFGIEQEFAIILHAPPKVDTSDPSRQLAGVLLPWRMVPGLTDGYVDRPARISWKHLDDSETVYRELYRRTIAWPGDWENVDQYTPLDTTFRVHLHDHTTISHGLFVDYKMSYPISTDFWSAGNSATLSKDTSTYHSGTQSLKVLYGGTANPYAEGPLLGGVEQLKVGCDYVISGQYAGDGSANPSVVCGGDTLATGTSSTSWQSFNAAFTADDTAIRFIANTSTATQYCNFDSLYLREVGRFRYHPDADGEFTVGFLKVERMRVAALSIFSAPDQILTNAQAIVRAKHVAEGRAIRGYTGTGVPSIGDLEYTAGKGGSDYDVDDMERCTRRALICSGHPTGLSLQTSASYYNIRGGQTSYFKVTPRNLLGKTSGNVSTIPVLYGYCNNAGVGNEGYVKYTALTSGDTWEYDISSDSAALWTDSNRLDVNATGDLVKIEFKAPPNGWLVCQSYALWEDRYDA